MIRKHLIRYLAAPIATGVFFVLAAASIDTVTHFLGPPSRGVGYGIGIQSLGLALAIAGAATLTASYWVGRAFALTIGTALCLICVVALFPQPSLLVRLLLGVWISVLLSILVLVLRKLRHIG